MVMSSAQAHAELRGSRARAARTALALCASADALAREMEVEVATAADDHRLFALLEQRDVMLQDLHHTMSSTFTRCHR